MPQHPEKKVLSVRSKILFTIAVSIVVFSVLVYLISTQVLLASYLAIEHRGMEQDVRRATDAIEEFSNQQLIKLSDWAAWDEAYEYARDQDPVWAEETIYATGLANLDINAMFFSDLTGKPITLMVVDIAKRVEVSKQDIENYITQHSDLITFRDLAGETKGIVMLPEDPLILVSLPLRTSEGKGPSTGSITFARYLDVDKVAAFSDITHLTIDIFRYDSSELPFDVTSAKQSLDAGDATVVVPMTSELLAGYTLIRDVYGNPALILRVETPRPIYVQGNVTFATFMGIGAGALLIFGLIIVLLLERFVITRFVRLTSEVEKVNDVKDLSIRITGGERDEIGRLGDKINQMLTWLSEAKEGEAASRREIVNLLDELKREKELKEEMAGLLAIQGSRTSLENNRTDTK